MSRNNIRRPLQGLLIAGEEDMHLVKEGRLSVTVREGLRDYTPGTVLIGCHLMDWAVLAVITQVQHTTLRYIPHSYLIDLGCETLDELLTKLQEFYPKMTFDSPITTVEWKLINQ